jgi:hypothetical protein
MIRSVLQDWVMDLPLMQQATLISGVRGPDGVSKNGLHKEICRYLRYLTLNPAHDDHLTNPTDKFMSPILGSIGAVMADFVNDHDEYPMHWLLHIVHAFEILGYKHPIAEDRARCWRFYSLMADCFHLNTETERAMNHRLNA